VKNYTKILQAAICKTQKRREN